MSSRTTPMTRAVHGHDAPEMNLPEGSTCADCRHFARCNAMFGHIAADEVCDWIPSRFSPARPAAVPAPLGLMPGQTLEEALPIAEMHAADVTMAEHNRQWFIAEAKRIRAAIARTPGSTS